MVRFDLACQPAKVRTYPVCFRERRLAVLFSLKRAEFDSIRRPFREFHRWKKAGEVFFTAKVLYLSKRAAFSAFPFWNGSKPDLFACGRF